MNFDLPTCVPALKAFLDDQADDTSDTFVQLANAVAPQIGITKDWREQRQHAQWPQFVEAVRDFAKFLVNTHESRLQQQQQQQQQNEAT